MFLEDQGDSWKQKINLIIFLMINTLLTKSKNFQKQLYGYLDQRKPNDLSKLKVQKDYF